MTEPPTPHARDEITSAGPPLRLVDARKNGLKGGRPRKQAAAE